MGLALCHSLPRDVLIHLALLLLFAAFVLQIGFIGRHFSTSGAGYIARKGEKGKEAALAYVALHPALYSVKTVDGKVVVDDGVKLCNPSAPVLNFHCARFGEGFHNVNGLVLASFISAVIGFVIVVFIVGRVARTTASLLYRTLMCITLPMTLQCAALGIFFARVIGNAKKEVMILNDFPADTKLYFHLRYGPCLAITSTALFCVAFILAFIRWIVTICLRNRLKKTGSPTDAERVKKMHLVNDDWERQKQILRSHARSVQVEKEIKDDVGSERMTFHQSCNKERADVTPPHEEESADSDYPFSAVEVPEPKRDRKGKEVGQTAPEHAPDHDE
ncbi:hypothetical protein, conserved [Angomonas deanei]|uniref:Uncharacterized protein n=1 Tax=Angomonas deanei TaxID=59799 RepID=A0A7G2C8J3_9TRYP|nr:hypothetical protein, conserved [Angomonas deanei]